MLLQTYLSAKQTQRTITKLELEILQNPTIFLCDSFVRFLLIPIIFYPDQLWVQVSPIDLHRSRSCAILGYMRPSSHHPNEFAVYLYVFVQHLSLSFISDRNEFGPISWSWLHLCICILCWRVVCLESVRQFNNTLSIVHTSSLSKDSSNR